MSNKIFLLTLVWLLIHSPLSWAQAQASDLSLIQDKIKKLKTAVEQLTHEKEQVEAQLIEANAGLAQKETEIVGWEEKMKEVLAVIPEKDEKINILEAAIEKYYTQIKDKNSVIEQLTREKDELANKGSAVGENSDKDATIAFLQERIEAIKTEVDKKDSALQGRDQMLGNVKDRLVKFQAMLDGLNKKIVYLTDQNTQLKATYEAQLQDKDKELAAKGGGGFSEEERTKLMEEIKGLRRQIENTSAVDADVNKLRQALEEEKKQLQESMQKQIQALEEELQAKKLDINQKDNAILQLKADNAATQNVQKQNGDFDAQVKQIKDDAQKQLAAIEEQLKAKDAAAQALQKQHTEIQEQMKTLREESQKRIEAIQAQVDSTAAEMAKKDETIRQLQTESATAKEAQKQNVQHQEEMKQLRQQVEEALQLIEAK